MIAVDLSIADGRARGTVTTPVPGAFAFGGQSVPLAPGTFAFGGQSVPLAPGTFAFGENAFRAD